VHECTISFCITCFFTLWKATHCTYIFEYGFYRNEPWGKQTRLITDVTSTALGKEEMAISL
jgi:hypothetical protein